MKVHINKYDRLLFGGLVLTLVLNYILPFRSALVEQYYSNGLFVIYRKIWDTLFGWMPFALIYLIVIALLVYLISSFFSNHSIGVKVRRLIVRLLRSVSFGLILFYWLWGYNYKRQSLRSALLLCSEMPNETFVYEEYCRLLDSLTAIRDRIDITNVKDWMIEEEELAVNLRRTLTNVHLSIPGKVRGRRIRPKGVLLHFSTAGIYLPFAGEGHIDAALHPITHPFTMMHEMSHGYGWTGEDECNFLALLGTLSSENDIIRYSGYFAYWRYIRSHIIRADKERFLQYYNELPNVILKDYQEIIDFHDKYPDWMPVLRDLIYDSYLKSHGISSGLINYSEVIKLSYQWQLKHQSLSL